MYNDIKKRFWCFNT